MNIDAKRLREKGWSEAEIKHTQNIIGKVKRRKHPHRNALNETIYWGMLLLAVLTIISINYWIFPLFYFSKAATLYPIVIIIGLVFGMLFSHIIKDLEHLEPHHHLIFSAIVPITSAVSFFTILTNMSDLGEITGIHHSIWTTAVVFTFAFITPYIYYLVHQKL